MIKVETCPICHSVLSTAIPAPRRGFKVECCAGCPWSVPKAFVPAIIGDLFIRRADNSLPVLSNFANSSSSPSEITVAALEVFMQWAKRNEGECNCLDPVLLPIEQVGMEGPQAAALLSELSHQLLPHSPKIAGKIGYLASLASGFDSVFLVPGRGPDLVIETLALARGNGNVVEKITVCRGGRSAVQVHMVSGKRQVERWKNGRAIAVFNTASLDGTTREFSYSCDIRSVASKWLGKTQACFLVSTDPSSTAHATISKSELSKNPAPLNSVIAGVIHGDLVDTRFPLLYSWTNEMRLSILHEDFTLWKYGDPSASRRSLTTQGAADQHPKDRDATMALASIAQGEGLHSDAIAGLDPMFSMLCGKDASLTVIRIPGKRRPILITQLSSEVFLLSRTGWVLIASGMKILFKEVWDDFTNEELFRNYREPKVPYSMLIVMFNTTTRYQTLLMAPGMTGEQYLAELQTAETDLSRQEIVTASLTPTLGKLLRGLFSEGRKRVFKGFFPNVASALDLPGNGRMRLPSLTGALITLPHSGPSVDNSQNHYFSLLQWFLYHWEDPVGVIHEASGADVVIPPFAYRSATPRFIHDLFAPGEASQYDRPVLGTQVFSIAMAISAARRSNGGVITIEVPEGGDQEEKRLKQLLVLGRALGISRIISPEELGEFVPKSLKTDLTPPILLMTGFPRGRIVPQAIIFCVKGAEECRKANSILSSLSHQRELFVRPQTDTRKYKDILNIGPGNAVVMAGVLWDRVSPMDIAMSFRDRRERWSFRLPRTPGFRSGGTKPTRREVFEAMLNNPASVVPRPIDVTSPSHEEWIEKISIPMIPMSLVFKNLPVRPKAGRELQVNMANWAAVEFRQTDYRSYLNASALAQFLSQDDGLLAVPASRSI